MDTDFRSLLERFTDLGGIAENICQRVGEHGRGIFPIDSSRRAKIMTPRNLLLNANDFYLDGEKVAIKDGERFTVEQLAFLEMYWNHLLSRSFDARASTGSNLAWDVLAKDEPARYCWLRMWYSTG